MNVHNIKRKRLLNSIKNNPKVKDKEKKIKKNEQKQNSKTVGAASKSASGNKPRNTNLDNFHGEIGNPESRKLRSNKKIREQGMEHMKKVHKEKKTAKKLKEKLEIKREKQSMGKTKTKKKLQDSDKFTDLVDKYKQMINKKDQSTSKASKRSKWYAE